MAGRQLFSEDEKNCLQELVLKYKLNLSTVGSSKPGQKRQIWMKLTQEYNSIETNSKRTEQQLRKLYENIKTRKRLQAQSGKIRETMKIDEPEPQSPSISPSLFQEESLDIPQPEPPLVELAESEMPFEVNDNSTTKAPVNYKNQAIREELSLRLRRYNILQRREEELHRIRMAEGQWLVKAAKEQYKKWKLEREMAEEMVRKAKQETDNIDK